ncbi:AV2 protein [Vernonia yellow vein virus]|uniref:Protein V2 n=1 Tax=Vernonia yellow vein virus TaxID=367061 RepID=Q2MCS8_9GEMI|nr:AV2 protein [Vernonia yellow vein virus]CAJ57817.1 AV2 protein [Vernonia yellow vein virus]
MWDPLLHEFPETVHGLRCMLAVKYLSAVADTYSPDTLGFDLLRDLICVVRARNYVEATSRYSDFNSRIQSTSSSEFRQPLFSTCCCPHCPRHQKTNVDQQAHVPKAQALSDVQKQ